MEIIMALIVVALAAAIYFNRKKPETKGSDDFWPFGEKLPEGKIHVKVDDVSTSVVAEAVTTVVENNVEAPAKKKKPAVKKAPAIKKAPAKKTKSKKA